MSNSIVTALGAGSGIDMAALAGNLAKVQFEDRINRLSARSEALDTKISTASAIKSQISQLASALGERVRTGDLAPTPAISNPAVATVSRAAATKPVGSYTLEVTRLASAQALTAPAFAAAASTVGSGTLTLRLGSISGGAFTADAAREPVEITIAPGATLAQAAAAINSSGAGVSAYVANSADGARLVLKGPEGANNAFVIEAAEDAGNPGLAALAWEPASGDPARVLSSAGDAEFKLDGVAMKSASNAAGEVAPGLSLTLKATNAGNPATITFNDAKAAVTSVMQDLTAALNEIVSALNAATDPATGELARDDGARALRRQLSSLGSTVIMPNAANGVPGTLAELGLSIARDGSFSLNSATLTAALTRDPEGVAAMFTNGLYGVYASIDKIARNASTAGNPGSLAGSLTRYASQKSQISEENAKIADQQEALRARLAKQLSAADVQIGSFKSTQSFLQQQIEMWKKSDD
jgi:flagellar hook-associated protein 2